MMYESALRERSIDVRWLPLGEVMEEVSYGRKRTLLQFCDEDPYATTLDAAQCALKPNALIRSADAALLVCVDHGPYEAVLTHMLDEAGIVQPNTPSSVDIAKDKWTSYALMHAAGLPVPRAALVNNLSELDEAGRALGFPLVVKELSSQQGLGVRLARDEEESRAVAIELEIDRQHLMVQHYVECGATDVRTVVVDGELVAAMERKAQPGEFRANLALGGTASPCEISAKDEFVVRASVNTLGLAVAGMDTARVTEALPGREYLAEGDVFFIEANPFPGLKGLRAATGIDASGLVIDMVLREVARKKYQVVS